ncbi:MAG TPA: UDP-glucose/GDP-mannose dehydrogenase family protein, partial [Elusimicrobiales bacterium]|nr:UDP-glucose/GDP-mannose dehydrogenase family protein [Elusimicrobiales bacterium]
MDNAKKIFGNKIYFAKNPYDCVKDSDCVCLVTEWDEFKKIDFKKVFKMVKHPVMIDGRNLYNPKEMRDMGFTYISVGRP